MYLLHGALSVRINFRAVFHTPSITFCSTLINLYQYSLLRPHMYLYVFIRCYSVRVHRDITDVYSKMVFLPIICVNYKHITTQYCVFRTVFLVVLNDFILEHDKDPRFMYGSSKGTPIQMFYTVYMLFCFYSDCCGCFLDILIISSSGVNKAAFFRMVCKFLEVSRKQPKLVITGNRVGRNVCMHVLSGLL